MPQSYVSYEQGIEDSNWYSCCQAAMKAGFTKDQAEMCDNSNLNCLTCPWK